MINRVLIADSQPVVIAGLHSMLRSVARKIDDAKEGCEVLSLVHTLQPNLVILGCNLPDLPATQVVRQIRHHNLSTLVLIYSHTEETDFAQQMIEAGATGYLLKTEPREIVLQAVRSVSRGEAWLSPSFSTNFYPRFSLENGNTAQFTNREKTILKGLWEGKSNHSIAAQYGLTEQTVKNNLTRIYKKLEVSSRLEAIVKVAHLGLFISANSA